MANSRFCLTGLTDAWRLNEKAAAALEGLQGRWRHSLNEMGMFTVFGDVAFFDKGTSLRLLPLSSGGIEIGGWHSALGQGMLGMDLLRVGWRRPGVDSDLGDCSWIRVDDSMTYLQDRWARGGDEVNGLPMSTALFTVPPHLTFIPGPAPSAPPAAISPRKLKLLVYGDSLTIGFPSGDPYARGLVDGLAAGGVTAEVLGCGIGGATSSKLAENLDQKIILGVGGVYGAGLSRMLRQQGPIDLVLIMAGTCDLINEGSPGKQVFLLHEACHQEGVDTVALSVPPSWHDCPEDIGEDNARKMRELYEMITTTKVLPETVARLKKELNKLLRLRFETDASQEAPLPGEPRRGRIAAFVDTWELISCNERQRNLWVTADWLHFNSQGSHYVGRGIAQRLLPLLLERAADATEATTVAVTEAARPSRRFTPRDPELRSLLQFARPDWKLWEIEGVLEKLAKIDVNKIAEFHRALLGKGEGSLNQILKAAGQRGFAQNTLHLMREQFEHAERFHKFRCDLVVDCEVDDERGTSAG